LFFALVSPFGFAKRLCFRCPGDSGGQRVR
jgi:hypothetical protein